MTSPGAIAPVVAFEDVSFSYAGRPDEPALEGITLEVLEGEFLALAGLNGSGKSTLCKLINALILPTRGRVTACGMDTLVSDNLQDIRRLVGLVMQNPDNQIVGPTVEDDLAFGPENLALDREEIATRVEEALGAMDLAALRGREPHLLSVGERKRLAVAGVLTMHPRVLVSDESTSMLDPPTRAETISLFSRLRADYGLTVIHATHRPEEIIMADRVVLLGGGRLLFAGTPEELFDRRELAEEQGLHPPELYELARELEAIGLNVHCKSQDAEEVAERICPSS